MVQILPKVTFHEDFSMVHLKKTCSLQIMLKLVYLMYNWSQKLVKKAQFKYFLKNAKKRYFEVALWSVLEIFRFLRWPWKLANAMATARQSHGDSGQEWPPHGGEEWPP